MSYDIVSMWWCYNHRIKFINFCIINSNTFYILFYKWTTWWKHLRDIGASPNIFWLLSELMRMHWNSIFNMFFLMTSFHCLILLFFWLLFRFVGPVFSWFLYLLMLMLFCLFWTCIWNIQWRWSCYVDIWCG